jgi:signal transduction histidine kinase
VLALGRSRWFGYLSVAAGCAFFVECWRFSDVPLFYTAGLLFGSVWGAVLFQMILAFPSGHLRGRLERWLVGWGYVFCLVAQPLPFLFWDEDFRPVCEDCPRNLAVIDADHGIGEAMMTGFIVVGTVGLLAMAAYFIFRWRRMPRQEREQLVPVVVTFAASIVLALVSAVAEGVGALGVAQAFNVAYLAAFAALPFAFLVALLRTRASRAEAVGELVERLSGDHGRGGLRAALAEALDDPALELAYWLPERECYVDAGGRTLARGEDGRTWTEIAHDGRRLAAVIHDPALSPQPATGAAIALALQRERLEAALRANVLELRASRARIVEAGDDARRRIERDLHDGAQQRLVSLLLNLQLERRRLMDGAAAPLLDETERELADALIELRALAAGILPPALTDHGLDAAVHELADRSPLPVAVVAMPERRLPAHVAIAAYFVIAEALTNAAKHAQASRATISAVTTDDRVRVEIADDGIGGASAEAGSGLRGLADRIEALDGRLTIVSHAGAGTTVRAELPCAS